MANVNSRTLYLDSDPDICALHFLRKHKWPPPAVISFQIQKLSKDDCSTVQCQNQCFHIGYWRALGAYSVFLDNDTPDAGGIRIVSGVVYYRCW